MTAVMKDSQEGQPESAHICMKGNSFSGDIRARQLEQSIYSLEGLQARAMNIQLCEKAQLTEHKEGGRCMTTSFCYPQRCLMQVRTMLCSDLACVYNSQSSCVVVEEIGPLYGTAP